MAAGNPSAFNMHRQVTSLAVLPERLYIPAHGFCEPGEGKFRLGVERFNNLVWQRSRHPAPSEMGGEGLILRFFTFLFRAAKPAS